MYLRSNKSFLRVYKVIKILQKAARSLWNAKKCYWLLLMYYSDWLLILWAFCELKNAPQSFFPLNQSIFRGKKIRAKKVTLNPTEQCGADADFFTFFLTGEESPTMHYYVYRNSDRHFFDYRALNGRVFFSNGPKKTESGQLWSFYSEELRAFFT